ncbi:MAG: metal ABC transporter ATP-binding protein [Acidimicrobiales bacterium]
MDTRPTLAGATMTSGEERPEGAAVVGRDLELTWGRAVALRAASFALPSAATIALVGPNGAGKTTLLHAIAGLLRPTSGSLTVPARRVRRANVAYVMQATPMAAEMPLTVREVVTMGRYGHLGPFRPLRGDDRSRVDAALERLGVGDLQGRQLRELSGGQRQRVFVAQGLVQEADLLLLDEPVTGLDLLSRQRILEAVAAERAAGRTVVMSTHDLGDAQAVDHVVLLAGVVVAHGAADEVLTLDNLSLAYGGRMIALEGGLALFDDGAHHP